MAFEDELTHPKLMERDIDILRALRGRQLAYVQAGRPKEAHGIRAAMHLIWLGFTNHQALLDFPIDTHPMELGDDL